MLNKWTINSLFTQLIKGNCLLCDAPTAGIELCEDCFSTLPRSPHRCPVCSLPASQGKTCGHCLREKPYFDQTTALFDYAHPVDYLVRQLKFHRKLAFARLLGQFLRDRLKSDTLLASQPQLVLPVPLHKQRLRQRGFNQSLELARPLAKALNIPLTANLCTRTVNTEQQTAIPAAKRKSNVKQAFTVTSSLNPEHVLIVDDVMTTGATVNELARVLKQAGVARISVLVVARAC